jgi:recombination protein RecA|tara:strand:+ start:2418 stop:3407 length:990 start_codon:yes stop_codon:yes gene_type:complete
MAKNTKSSGLQGVTDSINALLGSGTMQSFEDTTLHDVTCTSSGGIALDIALGGGYPQGRIIEIYGPESSGKTTLAIHAGAEVQDIGKAVVFLDLENAFDPEYGAALGLDYSKDKWVFSQPECGEDAFTIIEQYVQLPEVGMIIVDSVACMTPRAEMEGEFGESKMGLHARLMSQGFRKLVGKIKKADCTLIFLNQTRDKIGVMFGNPETTTGGNALKFYASQRLRVGRKQGVKGKDGILITNHATVKVEKNKIAPPHKKAEFEIRFGEGIDKISEILDIGADWDVIEKKGAWYYYDGTAIGQGKEKARETLIDNIELREEIENKIREFM